MRTSAVTGRMLFRLYGPRIAFLLLAFPGFPSPQAHAQVDPDLSFYVPQAGSVATPFEGTLAYRFFVACPNNDGGTSLANHARIKVVLRDGAGVPIVGFPAADICILFNGGTAEQGFTGSGADSIIANATFNPNCPDVRCIPADAPTDTSGTTYITFVGADPLNPGVALRDAGRKWGHYDTDIPAFAGGVKLPGRLTTASANGTYVLRIKNFDIVDGLGTELNAGEAVTAADRAAVEWVLFHPGPLSYWADFNFSGSVTAIDLNTFIAHINHDCDTPNNP